MTHYKLEELDCYKHGEMSIYNRIKCAKHLKNCQDCQKKLLKLNNNDKLIIDVKRNLNKFKELTVALSDKKTTN